MARTVLSSGSLSPFSLGKQRAPSAAPCDRVAQRDRSSPLGHELPAAARAARFASSPFSSSGFVGTRASPRPILSDVFLLAILFWHEVRQNRQKTIVPPNAFSYLRFVEGQRV